MARYLIAPIPEGYNVLTIGKRHYPVKIHYIGAGIPLARSFVKLTNSAPVFYAKRAGAVNFLTRWANGEETNAQVAGEESEATP